MHSEEFELIDGRIVQRSPSGRYRDKRTGKWLSKVEVESKRLTDPASPPAPGDQPAKPARSTREFVLEAVEQAVREQGHQVVSTGEAWGKVMQVQAEIALDKNNAAKATAAARMLAQQTNIMDEPEGDQEDQTPWFVLGRKLAMEMLSIIQEEKSRREGEDET